MDGFGSVDGEEADEIQRRQQELRRIVARIRSLLLPAGVLDIWTDEDGALQDILEPAEAGHDDRLPFQPVH